MSEKENKSLIRRFVEGNKKFKREIHGTYIGGSFGIFVAGFIISYFLLDNLEKTNIVNTIIISLIFTIISFLTTFSIKPKVILVFSAFISILISSILKVL